MGWSRCLGASWWEPHAGLVGTCPLSAYVSLKLLNTERMKSHAVDTGGRLCSEQFLPRSQFKNVSPSPKLGAGLEQMNLKQDGC